MNKNLQLTTMKNLGKILALSVAMFSATVANAQQTVYKLKRETNQTIVELFQIRNGTSLINTYGSGWYDQGGSAGTGMTVPYLESTGQLYTSYSYTKPAQLLHTLEQVGNGTFLQANPQPYLTSNESSREGWKGDNDSQPLPKPLSILEYNWDLDAVEDSDSMIDVLKSRWILPHTYDDGTLLPAGF